MPRQKGTPQQRAKHSARRQAKYRADARKRMAQHAASEIVSREWDGARRVTSGQVVAKVCAMYGDQITPAEARAALDYVLNR